MRPFDNILFFEIVELIITTQFVNVPAIYTHNPYKVCFGETLLLLLERSNQPPTVVDGTISNDICFCIILFVVVSYSTK